MLLACKLQLLSATDYRTGAITNNFKHLSSSAPSFAASSSMHILLTAYFKLNNKKKKRKHHEAIKIARIATQMN